MMDVPVSKMSKKKKSEYIKCKLHDIRREKMLVGQALTEKR
jgi:hypothetical protein